MGYLRASNYYSLEKAYEVCKERDFVPEMVFLLGRMGNSKQALMLIIERLGDVQRVSHSPLDAVTVGIWAERGDIRQAIEFAREQADEDLWEDLLRYSESKPSMSCRERAAIFARWLSSVSLQHSSEVYWRAPALTSTLFESFVELRTILKSPD